MKAKHVIVGMMMLIPATAALAEAPVCCASGDNGKPKGTSLARSSTDLGQVSPSVPNVSLQPDYQVFQFTRNGLRYTEVADASGSPRAAFAVVDGALLTLPIGQDTVQQVVFVPAWPDVVYDDAAFIVAKRTVDGAITWQVYIK